MDSSAIFFLLLSIVVALTSETPFVFAFCPHRLPPPSARCLHPPSPKHSAGRRESDIQLRPSARAIPLHWPATAARRVALRAASSDDSIPVEITLPTPDAAAGMGIRDWPQQFHSSTWTDTCREGGIATRYVLDGKGRLTIDYYDNDGERRRIENQRVYPGTLVEVEGEADLLWEVDDGKEGMIVLTPGYEEGGKLALVGGALLIFCAGLVVGAGGL